MIAWAGAEKLALGISNAIENQEPIPRWPIGIPSKEFSKISSDDEKI